MRRLVRRFGVRILEHLGITYDVVDVMQVVVVRGVVNERRFLLPRPEGRQ